MSVFNDEINDCLTDVENDLGDTFTWLASKQGGDGNTYACVASNPNSKREPMPGADFTLGYDLKMTVRTNQFPGSLPQSQQLILFHNVKYRIVKVVNGISFIRLFCEYPSKLS